MTRIPPPVLGLGAALAQRALAGARRPPTAVRSVAAAASALASLAMAGTAANRFRRSGTTTDPLHPDRASFLVTTGANAVTRNPMYVGMAGLLTAHALWRGSWVALVPVGGFVVAVDRLQIRAEEAALRDRFGAEYDAYVAHAPRWLGPRSPWVSG